MAGFPADSAHRKDDAHTVFLKLPVCVGEFALAQGILVTGP